MKDINSKGIGILSKIGAKVEVKMIKVTEKYIDFSYVAKVINRYKKQK